MGHVRFPPKAVTVYFREEEGFDCKNNHGCGKSANFRLDNISKFNSRTLVVFVVIYLIRVGVEKGSIDPKALQIVYPITMQLVVNSYQRSHLLHSMSPKAHD